VKASLKTTGKLPLIPLGASLCTVICTYISSHYVFISGLTLLDGCQEEHPTCIKLSDEVLEWLSL